MGLVIREFVAAKDRDRVRAGELFEVELECGWEPLDQGGSGAVELSCEQAGFSVSSRGVDVTVDPDGGITTKRFRIAVSGPGGEMVDVVASASSGSTDSFLIRVVR
jgi:hypothetical protein